MKHILILSWYIGLALSIMTLCPSSRMHYSQSDDVLTSYKISIEMGVTENGGMEKKCKLNGNVKEMNGTNYNIKIGYPYKLLNEVEKLAKDGKFLITSDARTILSTIYIGIFTTLLFITFMYQMIECNREGNQDWTFDPQNLIFSKWRERRVDGECIMMCIYPSTIRAFITGVKRFCGYEVKDVV